MFGNDEPTQLETSSGTRVLGQVLSVEAVRPEDAGTYRCLAGNDAGQTSAETRLDVVVPLRVQVIFNNCFQSETHIAILCVQGYAYIWKHFFPKHPLGGDHRKRTLSKKVISLSLLQMTQYILNIYAYDMNGILVSKD